MESDKYAVSSNGRYILSRDGKEVARGLEFEVIKYLHRTHGFSASHALKYEGYKIEPEETPGPEEVTRAAEELRALEGRMELVQCDPEIPPHRA